MKKTLLLITLWILSLSTNAQCWKFVATSKDQGFPGFTLAIATNGTLWAFGYNGNGQLGDGTTTDRTLPVQIGTDNNWVYLSAASRHALAIKADGTLWSWGDNSSYSLGDGTNVSRSVPKQVGTDTNWKTVSTHREVVIALKSNGTIWRWGSDGHGNGSPSGMWPLLQYTIPTQIGTDTDWIWVERGNTFSMALKSDGSRWGYGAFLSGVAGNGNVQAGSSGFIQLDAGPWQSISIGAHALGVKQDGSLWSWGDNSGGQVGNGSIANSVNAPVLIDNSHKWKVVSTGYNIISESGISFAVRDDNTLWSWGGARASGTVFTLGQGTTVPTSIPKQVGDNTNWNSVSAGGNYTAGIQSDNTLWTWGYISSGQLGNGATSQTGEYVLSPFKVSCATPLPVTLQQFSVTEAEFLINLKWTTSSETNADHFEIQRSLDTKTWYAIGAIKAEGSQSNVRNYEFTDSLPLPGKNYYRLKMIDLDQTSAYSSVRYVKVDAHSIVLFPNPVSDILLIDDPRSVKKIELVDVNGRIVGKYQLYPKSGINVKSLSAGLYLVLITKQNGSIQRQRIVVKR